MDLVKLKTILDAEYSKELPISFIESDPVQIPRSFSLKQDIEITAFWTAMLAWGQRKTIIDKSKALFNLMDNAPYEFIMSHNPKDLERFAQWKHRTFQYTDTLYFIHFFKEYYQNHDTLEAAFLVDGQFEAKMSISQFHELFFASPLAPHRTKKHVATPARNSACKRINLFLKWMVRQDSKSGDMGIFNSIRTCQLKLPLDVHVLHSAKALGMIHAEKTNWKLVETLSNILLDIDPNDPIKYDYSLFNLSKSR